MRARSTLLAAVCALVVSSLIGAGAAAATRAPRRAQLPTISSIDAPEGPSSGGTKVVIRGEHLAHASSVLFGRHTAPSIAVKGAHQIVAVTPRHPAGESVVHVVAPAGKSRASSASSYRFGREDPLQWSDPTTIDPSRGSPEALSCPTTTFCALVDSSGGLITYDGASWTDVTPAGVSTWDAVYCWSDALCFADSRGSVSTYDGTNWSAPVPTFDVALEAMTCWSDVGCRAFDWYGHELRYDGTTWSRTGRTVANAIGITCSSAGHCDALATFGAAYVLDGGEWTPSSSLPSDGSSVAWDACAPDRSCLATTEERDGKGAYQFDGSQWQTVADAPFTVYSLSCASRTFCAAMSDQATASIYDGSTWSSPISLGLLGERLPSVVACAPERSCMAVDHFGTAASFDGASVGQAGKADALRGWLSGVSCPTATWCMSIDGFGNWLTRDDTGSWSPAQPGAGSAALSCSSPTFCISTGGRWSWTWDGDAWSRLPNLPPAFDAFSSSCPADGYCMVFDHTGHAEVLAHGAWRASGHPLSASTRVSCWSKGNCLAVGRHRAAWLTDSHWSSATTVAGRHAQRTLTSVDCPSKRTCFIGTGGGAVMTAVGQHRTITDHVLADPIRMIDCATTTTCVAVGTTNEPDGTSTANSAVYGAQGWSTSAPVDPSVRAIACPSNTNCVAVGEAVAYAASVRSS